MRKWQHHTMAVYEDGQHRTMEYYEDETGHWRAYKGEDQWWLYRDGEMIYDMEFRDWQTVKQYVELYG